MGWTHRRRSSYKWGPNLDYGIENLIFFIAINCILFALSWWLPGGIGLVLSFIGLISTLAVHYIWTTNERFREKIAAGLYSIDYLSKQFQIFESVDKSSLRRMPYWEKWALESIGSGIDPCDDKHLHAVVARLPDLRLIHALSLVFLLLHPMLMIRSLDMWMPGTLYNASVSSTPIDWLIFSLETGIRAFSDIFEIYDTRISSITANSDWGRHLMFANRLFFDVILLRSLHREVIIFGRKRATVGHWKHDPKPGKRLGQRIRKRLERSTKSPESIDWDENIVGIAKDHLVNLQEWKRK
jgi:hypothetical protein